MVHFCHYGSPLFLLLLSALPLPLRGSKEMSQFIFPCLNSRFREHAASSGLITSSNEKNRNGFCVLPLFRSAADDGGLVIVILMVLGVACPVKFLVHVVATKQAQFSTKLSLVPVAACKHLTMVSVKPSSSVVDGRSEQLSIVVACEAAQIQRSPLLLPLSPFRFRLSRGRRPPDSSQLRRALSRILVTHSSSRKWAEKWQLTLWTYQRENGRI